MLLDYQCSQSSTLEFEISDIKYAIKYYVRIMGDNMTCLTVTEH